MRCDLCPAPAGTVCPAVAHPHYCNLVARPGPRGDRYREFVRTGAAPIPEHSGARPPARRVDMTPVYARFGRGARTRIDGGCVLMACDEAQFVPLQMALASLLLSHDLPATVVDLGLSAEQRRWVARQGVAVADPPAPLMPRSEPMWQTWNKPLYFALAARPKVLWLDNDILVDGDLSPLFAAIDAGPMLVRDFFARDEEIMANKPALYERFPVPMRQTNVCAGVVGLDLGRDADRAILGGWTDMLRHAAEDPGLRREIAWWDQGCLLWAMEGLGVRPAGIEAWNRAGRPQVALQARHGSPGEMLDGIPGGEAVLWHFQGSPKPYGWAPEFRLSLRPAPDLSVYILGHEPFERPRREHVAQVNLADLGPDDGFAESRIFAHLAAEDIPTEYVALASVSWQRKYESLGCPAPWELAELELRPKTVWVALATTDRTWFDSPDWTKHMENASPGITPYIEELRAVSGLKEVQPAGWSNNYVMHRSVYADLRAFHAGMKAHFLAKYPECPYRAADPRRPWGYLAEAFSVHYLMSRADLAFRQIRWGATAIPSEPALPPLLTQARNLALAAARHASGGARKVSEAVLAGRLAICRNCERFRPSDRRCASCGCYLPLKATWASEGCPEGKWAAEPGAPAAKSGCGRAQAPAAK